MFKISEQWHCQEFEKENQSQGFWFSHTDNEEGISFLEGFAKSWLLPLQDIKEYWTTDWHQDILRGSIVIISQLDIFKHEREAKVKAGYHIAEYLCYYFDEEGHLIVSTHKDLEAYGWANSIDIDEGLEWE